MSTPEEKAREEAEARRKRILEKADDRIGLIEGTPVAKAGAAKDEDDAADVDAGDGDAAPAAKGKTTAGAARMAAARRRRFNKAAAAAAEAEAGTTADGETPAIAAAVAADGDGDDDKSKTDATTATEDTATISTKEEDSMEKVTEDSEKKYMGVAKMRRRKLMEQKKLQEEKEKAGGAGGAGGAGKSLSVANKKKKKHKSFLDRLPIFMHAVTVLILFVAGLDIGMQQHHDYGDDLIVHADFAPRQHGLQIVQKIKIPSFITKMMEPKTVEKMIVDEQELPEDGVPVIDEFADDDNVDDTPDNLDPLFGIDLDTITAGPGLLLFLARGAIFLHRLNLKIFYYFPRKVFSTIYGTVQQLVNTPPIMALTAITVRQLIGKVILGAKLPAKLQEKKTDVMSMGMNMVKTFILGAFPTLVSLYDGWTHLRSDIYVVLCGLFVGVVWHHYVSPSDASLFDVPDLAESVSGSVTGDEL